MPRGKKKIVEDVKADVAQKVEEVKAGVEEYVEEVKPAVERTIKNTRKNAAKATEKVKSAAAKVVGEAVPLVYVQYQGNEENVEDLVAAAKAAFAAEHARTRISGLKLYIKPEEHAAYYVVNDKFAGRVDF